MKFNINRFLSLIRRDFVLYRKPFFYGSIALVFIITLFLYMNATDSYRIYRAPYMLGLLLFGSVFTASNFIEFRNPSDRISYLSLPASTFEKFLTHMLYCTFGFLVYWCIVFGIGHFIANILIDYFTHNVSYGLFQPWSLGIEYNQFYKYWFMIQSGLFVFSVLFNRYAFVKSIFSMIPLILIYGLVMMSLCIMIYGEYFPIFHRGLEAEKLIGYTMKTSVSVDAFFEKVKSIRGVILYCLPLFLFVVAYFKLKEKEA